MHKPFFSIITATLNSEKYLADNLKSVDDQTFTDFEHIIIDGESTDTTLNILANYKNPRRKVLCEVPNGISAAFNAGIQASLGEYLLFLNSDDYLYDNNTLGNVHDFMIRMQKPDWVYGQKVDIEADGTPFGVFPTKKIFQIASPKLLKYVNFIPHQATYISKSVFEKYGVFETDLHHVMDYEFWLRIAPHTRWIFMNQKLCFYRVHAEARSTSIKERENSRKYQQIVLKRYLNRFDLSVFWVVQKTIGSLSKNMHR